jgi:hypothetical protein
VRRQKEVDHLQQADGTMGESGIFFSLRVYASYGLGRQVHDGLLERYDQAK